MASPSDLVSLATVKAWLSLPTPSADDVALGMLISQISRNILSHINRASVLPKTFTEIRDGRGKHEMMLRNYPVTSITSLLINGDTIMASPALTSSGAYVTGYVLELPSPEPPGRSQTLSLRHHTFWHGKQNVSVTYVAGYQVSAEPVIAAATVTVQQPFGAWGSDAGVVYQSTGVALTPVAAGVTPGLGQYALSTTVVGGYVFSTADAGAALSISYGFIPADLAEAALEWIGERYAYRQRIGISSKTLGGQETTSFAIAKLPSFIAEILQQYARVATF